MMLTVGVDAHKQIHMAVAVDARGTVCGTWRGANTPAGWAELATWAAALGDARQWGIEGAWNYGRGLAQHLVTAGERVYDINPRWTAERRQRARKPDKSDYRDAHAVAKVVQEADVPLPQVLLEDESAVLDLLVTERDGAMAEATRLRNQIHQLLLQLDPSYPAHLPSLTSQAGVRAVVGYTTGSQDALAQQRAAAVRRLAHRLQVALDQAAELARQIRTRVRHRYAPLAELCGIGLLSVGALVGILGPGQRFTRETQLAAFAGVAPVEASSAGQVRHRLNRGGHRRLNAILYRMALTQARCWPPAQSYLARRQAEGKTRREAIRALKRYLIRAIWQRWKQCVGEQDRQLGQLAAEHKEQA
jgi:transposase